MFFMWKTDGDPIRLVQEILSISALEACKYINTTLKLGIDIEDTKISRKEINEYKRQKQQEERFKKWENRTFQLLCDYLRSLKRY